MYNTAHFIFKTLSILFQRKWISHSDIAVSYDRTAPTYSRWNQVMGKHTLKMLRRIQISNPDISIMDLACGEGFITENLLSLYPDSKFSVDASDISPEMIKNARMRIQNPHCRFTVSDAEDFLTEFNRKYDLICCGWALPYLGPNPAIKKIRNRLNSNGQVAVIMNAKGTLQNIESIFLKTMAKYPEQVQKLMNTAFHLPSGTSQLNHWFDRQGLKPAVTGEGNETVLFDSPAGVFNWLIETGALAGTEFLFEGHTIPEDIKKSLIQGIGEQCQINDHYQINHKFVWGIYGGTK